MFLDLVINHSGWDSPLRENHPDWYLRDDTYAGAIAELTNFQHKLPLADSFIYATALLHDATLWTQDEHFKGLPSVKYFAKAK